jgi:hypothetical protein
VEGRMFASKKDIFKASIIEIPENPNELEKMLLERYPQIKEGDMMLTNPFYKNPTKMHIIPKEEFEEFYIEVEVKE